MYLQLHDGPNMAQNQKYPNVPNLRLPEILKVSTRQIMTQAAEEASVFASEKIQKAIDKKNFEAWQKELPTLDLSAMENFQYEIVPEENNGMGFSWVATFQFIAANAMALYNFYKRFSKTVSLVRVNNRIDSYYNANYYQVQDLNNMTPQQIDQQLAIISGDLLNAGADKEKIDSMALSRFSQIYQQRKAMLPALSGDTIKLIGGAVLAYFFLTRK